MIKKSKIQNNYINLSDILMTAIKEKIILFFILLISIISAYTYSSFFITKKFSTHVIINDPDVIFFIRINKFLENYSKTEIFKYKDLSENINSQILSNDNVSLFLNNNKNLKSSQINQISINKLMTGRKSIHNGFQLIYPEGVDGLKLLNEYILFVQSKIINKYNEKINIVLTNYIEYLNDQKQIAERINLDFPQTYSNNEYNSVVLNNNNDNYTIGTKVLSEKILIAKKIKQSIASNNFNYNIFLEKATSQSVHSPNTIKITFVGLIIGVFIFCLLILFKLNKIKI
jgi:hypothetical protein